MIAAIMIGTLAFAVGFVYASFFEWGLHKYLMHSDKLMKYPYQAHQLEHHDIYKADASYFLNPADHTPADEDHLTFAWWNAPLLLSLHLPLFALAYFLGGWPAAAGAVTAMGFYYALYEYLHYCMHVPKNRPFERTRFFAFVQEHHRLHHVYYLKNLNVVIPIADYILGTRVPMKDPTLFEKLDRAREIKQERARSRQAELVAPAQAPSPSVSHGTPSALAAVVATAVSAVTKPTT